TVGHTKIPKDKRVLDNLARLLEMTSQGCTAVCFVNNKILISDNDIESGTDFKEDANRKVSLIRNVMSYFRTLAKGEEVSCATRDLVFKEICTKRIKGEASGYVQLDEEKIGGIALDVLNEYKTWRKHYASKSELYPIEQRKFMAVAYEISSALARDFIKIEKFLQRSNAHAIKDAFKGIEVATVVTLELDELSYPHYSLMKNMEHGYVILAIGKNIPGEKMHAEMKIIDYLVFTRVLQNTSEPIYIGIAKLCCNYCALALKAYHQYKSRNSIKTIADGQEVNIEAYVEKRDDHNLKFKGWAKPIFLYSGDELLGTVAEGNVGYYVDKRNVDFPIKKVEQIDEIALKGHSVYIYTDYAVSRMIQQQEAARALLSSLSSKTKQKRGVKDEGETFISQYQYSQSSAESGLSEEQNFVKLEAMRTDEIFSVLLQRYDSIEARVLILRTVEQLKKLEVNPTAIVTKGEGPQDLHALENAFNQCFNNNYWYQGNDIQVIGEQLWKDRTDVAFVGACGRAIGCLDVSEVLKQHSSGTLERKIVGIYNVELFHWIAFVVFQDRVGIKCLIKDSLGKLYKDLEAVIVECWGGVEIKTYTSVEQTDGTSCGIYALKNAEIFANSDVHSMYMLDHNNFYRGDAQEIMDMRKDFARQYAISTYRKVKEDTLDQMYRKDICHFYGPLAVALTNDLRNARYSLLEGDVEVRTNIEDPTSIHYFLKCSADSAQDYGKMLSIFERRDGGLVVREEGIDGRIAREWYEVHQRLQSQEKPSRRGDIDPIKVQQDFEEALRLPEDTAPYRDLLPATDAMVGSTIIVLYSRILYNNTFLNSYIGSNLLLDAYEIGGSILHDALLNVICEEEQALALLSRAKDMGSKALILEIMGAVEEAGMPLRAVGMSPINEEALVVQSTIRLRIGEEGAQQTTNTFYLPHEKITVSSTISSIIEKLSNKLDIAWKYKLRLHKAEITRFNEILQENGVDVTESLNLLRDPRDLKNKVLSKLHPDAKLRLYPDQKPDGEDFVFVKELEQKMNSDVDINTIIAEKAAKVQVAMYKTTLGIKVSDTVVDVLRAVNQPTLKNGKQLVFDTAHLYGVYKGLNGYGLAIGGLEASYQVYQGAYLEALKHVAITGAYMALPTAMAAAGIPYGSLVLVASMTAYSGYHLMSNVHSLYIEYTGEDNAAKSSEAYANLYSSLAGTPLQYIYEFDTHGGDNMELRQEQPKQQTLQEVLYDI
ncbi:hypothetical protein, partial [Rickettsiales endosymbiont of Peranema trichophorum]|uniref:hypothetical protein n=1 Tax=Rickettsiales endosymbiont of Peranema trichophorum TaxID=2486577 RepID=UPI0013EE639A